MNFCRGLLNKKKSSRLGFSLIELVIAIAIMVVLIGLIAPNFVQQTKKNREKACRQNREAILAVYQRCVYDTSVQALNVSTKPDYTVEGLGNVIPQSDGKVEFSPVSGELQTYAKCPVDKTTCYHVDGKYGINTSEGTAWIECPVCGDIVSIDMVGGFKHVEPSPDPDKPVPTKEPVVTPTPERFYTVTFNNMGHGKSVPSQTVSELTHYRATNPGSLDAPYYTFGGWFDNASCSGSTFDFSTEITHDMTLYAKWTHNDGTWPVWPYLDDDTWWDADSFTHGADVTAHNITSHNGEDKYVKIKTPTGIFKSKSGASFVGIEAADFVEIHEYEAASPEAYIHSGHNSAPALVQLSGNTFKYDITGKKDSDTIKFNTLVNGDLLIFNDNGTEYYYVFWHESESGQTITMSRIRNYEKHPANCYRVSTNVNTPYTE